MPAPDAPAPDPTTGPEGTDELVHRRRLDLQVRERPDAFVVVAHLTDERPWADGVDKVRDLHDMTLTVTVGRADLTITAAHAEMRRFPHAECPAIEDAFAGLVGLSVGRGYNRAVQERFGRELGCTHLEYLARAVGPVVVQALPSSAARSADDEEAVRVVRDVGANWLTNTCHVWAEGGPGLEKIALGWRPGGSGYPAPSAVSLRAKAAGGAAAGERPHDGA